MKIALVHDSLFEFGGAERVLLSLFKLYPDAVIYTAFADGKLVKEYFSIYKIHTLPIPQKFFSRHTSLFQAVAPLLWRQFDLREYDLVISISGHLMSNLVNPQAAFFIQYILCPPKNVFGLEGATPLQRFFPYHRYLIPIYKKAINSTPHLLTLSSHMQQILFGLFHRLPKVIYPPVSIPLRLRHKTKPSFFLIISRIDRSKSIELAIEACNRLHLPLVIIGQTNEPSYDKFLRTLANEIVTFAGFVRDEELRKYYDQALAFIFTSRSEDFGIAPLEAMAHCVPVIAYYGGGPKETILSNRTGEFYFEHTVSALQKTIKYFLDQKYDPKQIKRHAQNFSESKFQQKFKIYVNKIREISTI